MTGDWKQGSMGMKSDITVGKYINYSDLPDDSKFIKQRGIRT